MSQTPSLPWPSKKALAHLDGIISGAIGQAKYDEDWERVRNAAVLCRSNQDHGEKDGTILHKGRKIAQRDADVDAAALAFAMHDPKTCLAALQHSRATAKKPKKKPGRPPSGHSKASRAQS